MWLECLLQLVQQHQMRLIFEGVSDYIDGIDGMITTAGLNGEPLKQLDCQYPLPVVELLAVQPRVLKLLTLESTSVN